MKVYIYIYIIVLTNKSISYTNKYISMFQNTFHQTERDKFLDAFSVQ